MFVIYLYILVNGLKVKTTIHGDVIECASVTVLNIYANLRHVSTQQRVFTRDICLCLSRDYYLDVNLSKLRENCMLTIQLILSSEHRISQWILDVVFEVANKVLYA